MFLADFKPNFKKKIDDLHFKLIYLYNSDKKIGEQNKIDHDSRSIVQNRFKLIIISDVLNYRENLDDDDFFLAKAPLSCKRLFVQILVFCNLCIRYV